MTFVALAFSLAVACLGAVGAASPATLLAIVRRFQSPTGVYLATAIRLAFGLSLFLAAPHSRAPGPVQVLGIVIMVAGIVTPLFGLERFRQLLDWWSTRGTLFIRLWGACAAGLGLLVAYALVR